MTTIDVTNMKDGDFAGLALLQNQYGLVGVKLDGGAHSIVMVSATDSTLTFRAMYNIVVAHENGNRSSIAARLWKCPELG